MTSPPPRRRRSALPIEAADEAHFGDELLATLALQLGEDQVPSTAKPGRKVTVTVEVEDADDEDKKKPLVHNMAGDRGYSLTRCYPSMKSLRAKPCA